MHALLDWFGWMNKVTNHFFIFFVRYKLGQTGQPAFYPLYHECCWLSGLGRV
jgi:hypothetical protein